MSEATWQQMAPRERKKYKKSQCLMNHLTSLTCPYVLLFITCTISKEQMCCVALFYVFLSSSFIIGNHREEINSTRWKNNQPNHHTLINTSELASIIPVLLYQKILAFVVHYLCHYSYFYCFPKDLYGVSGCKWHWRT